MKNEVHPLYWLVLLISGYIPLNSPRHLFKQYAVIESLAHKVVIVRFPEKLLKFANNNICEIEAGFKGYFKCQVNVRLVGY